jgi:tRNA modification GTPase
VATDTIAAISTPMGGEGGVGVIKISGPSAKEILSKIFMPSSTGEIATHTVRHGWIYDNNKPIDEILAIFMAAPSTFTGEDVVELDCHSGAENLKYVLELSIRAGARLAQRGEFTKRAFLNGKMDLTQAESVIDMVKARTKEGSVLAASQLKGALSSRIRQIKTKLMDILSRLEASIDFPDEIDEQDPQTLLMDLDSTNIELSTLVSTADSGRIYLDGLTVAIVGRPNVGKSSILNVLLRHEKAIVHHEPGTTRDVIEGALNIHGVPFRILDTAGIRRARSGVESIGIGLSKKAMVDADIILLVIDSSDSLNSDDKELIGHIKDKMAVIALNKADLMHKVEIADIALYVGQERLITQVSALKQEGIKELEDALFFLAVSNKGVAQNSDVMINLRQKQCLTKANDALVRAVNSAKNAAQTDLITIDLKASISAISEATGEIVSQEVIDSIFERFCVGK